MPRGGFDASCLDRLLETDRQEYLDRDDVDPGVRRGIVTALERTGEWFGNHERFAHVVLDEVAEVPDPRILELGAGHGGLSAKLVEMHPTAVVTVTDVEPDSVAAIAAGPLGSDERVTVRVVDATEMAFDDGTFDLAVFALSFHHLPPGLAARVIAEGTRVADKLVIIDLPRPPAPLHLIRLATMLPWAPFIPFVHDGVISSLRSYSPSALRTLAAAAGPDVTLELRGGLLSPQVAVATRGRGQGR
ncbi:class I SAM-dependent methyltransferase [Mycolicibacterium sp. P1-18]|uniref:class I SAM-dependent methyltransferase n=1 Tax=Mycolicibacterium sp. P1-18 TaxID=2024615 RepID=UPI0011F23E62|nr:class I SAM-dependent methyltransferase [Mycolicibacterium sp. P1-18]KAA0097789.1 class I SAM-dependent methyltransferase [Mycolicibacterium sp. P1-18]